MSPCSEPVCRHQVLEGPAALHSATCSPAAALRLQLQRPGLLLLRQSSSEAAHPVDSSAPLAVRPSKGRRGTAPASRVPATAPTRRSTRPSTRADTLGCAIHPFVGGGSCGEGSPPFNRWSRFEFPWLGTLLLPSHLWCGFSSWAGPPAQLSFIPVRTSAPVTMLLGPHPFSWDPCMSFPLYLADIKVPRLLESVFLCATPVPNPTKLARALCLTPWSAQLGVWRGGGA